MLLSWRGTRRFFGRPSTRQGADTGGLAEQRGIAATLTASVVFSILLVSTFAVQSEAIQNARMAAVAEVEARISAQAVVLEGADAYLLLSGAQSALVAGPLTCTGDSGAAALLGGRSAIQTSGNITVSADVTRVGESALRDNLTLVRPFNGTEAGYLDFAMTIHTNGSDLPLGVEFDKTEVHNVHLPVRLEDGARVCRDSSASLTSALGQARLPNCSATAAILAVSSETENLTAAAGASGFGLSISIATEGPSGCNLAVTTQVTEPNVSGPGGTFTALWSQTSLVQAQT